MNRSPHPRRGAVTGFRERLRHARWWAVPALALPWLLATGCGSTQPSRLYLLEPMPETVSALPSGESTNDLVIAVGAVMVPKHVDQGMVITMANPNELAYSEFHRWASSVRDQVQQVLLENLSRLLGGSDVIGYPESRTAVYDHRVAVTVTRFSGVLGGTAELKAQWRIFDSPGEEPVLRRASAFQVDLPDGSYRAYVAAQSEMLQTLSREIADAVEEHVARVER